jgi:hypothetical protein
MTDPAQVVRDFVRKALLDRVERAPYTRGYRREGPRVRDRQGNHPRVATRGDQASRDSRTS